MLKIPLLIDRGIFKAYYDRNAVLPQFMTWFFQVGIGAILFPFPSTNARYTTTEAADSLINKA